LVKTAGLRDPDPMRNVTIHTLRHTFGSWLALRGVPLRRIQYLMGHNSIRRRNDTAIWSRKRLMTIRRFWRAERLRFC